MKKFMLLGAVCVFLAVIFVSGCGLRSTDSAYLKGVEIERQKTDTGLVYTARFENGVYASFLDEGSDGNVEQVSYLNDERQPKITFVLLKNQQNANNANIEQFDTHRLLYSPKVYFWAESSEGKAFNMKYRSIVWTFSKARPEMKLPELVQK
jgi:hypothetical protein